jgi:hypothetical protein
VPNRADGIAVYIVRGFVGQESFDRAQHLVGRSRLGNARNAPDASCGRSCLAGGVMNAALRAFCFCDGLLTLGSCAHTLLETIRQSFLDGFWVGELGDDVAHEKNFAHMWEA